MLRVRWLFLRLLGAIMLLAFVSLWLQIQGLSGPEGILPAERLLGAVGDALEQTHGSVQWWRMPTLGWISAGGTALDIMCVGGAVASALLMFNLLPLPSLILSWVLYLSLSHMGGVFMSYQWDVLLTEVALVSMFWTPAGLRPGLGGDISKISPWILRALLFKLMLSSGVVKVVSGDSSWTELTATTWHYWTQPLPHRVAWYAHQLPGWFHQASVAMTLIIELVVPFLIFAPRKGRLLAFFPLAGLQLIIAATGNYGFFNLLTLALCLTLLDDDALKRIIPGKLHGRLFAEAGEEEGGGKLQKGLRYASLGFSALFALLYVPHTVGKILQSARVELPEWSQSVDNYVLPWRSTGQYGLFAQMTTTRAEIEIEGSLDGRTWKTYRFKYKPGKVDEPPPFTAFHMPRLDWQMWFAGLEQSCRGSRWFPGLLRGLFQNSPEVVGLFENNPFPNSPPAQIRARRWEYTFADGKQHDKGMWWLRKEKGDWCPTVRREALLRDGDGVATGLWPPLTVGDAR